MIKSMSRDIGTALKFLLIPASFFLPELFGFCFLGLNLEDFSAAQLWPLAFAACWSVILAVVLYFLPGKAARVAFGLLYFAGAVYAGFQTGYYILFSEMMWLSEFRYASEGSDYASVLLRYPLSWWLGVVVMIAVGVGMLWRFPKWQRGRKGAVVGILAAVLAIAAIAKMPARIFQQDTDEAVSDYKRSKSAQAAYENMFNVHRLYRLCGLYQTLAKDIYAHDIYPLTPGYLLAQEEARTEIEEWFSQDEAPETNDMTGLLAGKNVILVLMESLDDWMVGEHTPTIRKLMDEGIEFTNFYTPVYGGIRTFNSEFCINTGSFLSSAGGYAFDYVTNSYGQSLPNQLRQHGYSALAFHYNSASFYSRGEFSPAMGYEEYVCYAEYLPWGDEATNKRSELLLLDDTVLMDNEQLQERFFREGPRLNFVITASAHLPFTYSDKMSQYGLERYPDYEGLTGNEETDCAYLKARMLDDFYTRLMEELEARGELQNTVIIGITDHYTYGYENKEALLELSDVEDTLLLEKTPCFIWSPELSPQKIDKVLNTSDLLPTVLNLLGIQSTWDYVGSDAFDPGYVGFVPFSDGSWIMADLAYNAGTKKYLPLTSAAQTVTEEMRQEISDSVQDFIRINNLILETDYYKN